MLKTEVSNCIYARSRTVRTLAAAAIAVVCSLGLQSQALAQTCTHTLTMFDTFGDGWNDSGNDNTIEIFVNGGSVGVFSLATGTSGSETFMAATGDVITTTYIPTDTFEDENSWEIRDAFGNLVCEDLGGATGPDQAAMRACGAGNCPAVGSPEACCFADGSCMDLEATACATAGGTGQGLGTSCATFSCPQPTAPNDDCTGAIALSIPGLVTGTTVDQGGETLGTCGTTDGTGGGVWYSVIGDGTTLTATTCNPGTNYDTKLRVYTDGCVTLTCVGGNDDGSPTGMSPDPACVIPETGSTANRASTVSWCAVSGVEYLILVHGFGAAEGDFELTISSDGIACVQACCFDDGTCQDLGTGECGTAGGTPQGPGTDCASVSCPQPEACCLPNGTCQDILTADCTGLGGTPQGAGRFCVDVTCPAPSCDCGTVINTFPYTEDFEADEPNCAPGAGTTGCGLVCALVGDWENRANGLFDDTDFLTDQGGTTSGGTGPSVDATLGTATGNYAFIETSGNCGSGVAQMISPCFDLTGTGAPAFSFAYHMFGDDTGTLTVEVTSDSCQNLTQEFTISGQQSVDGTDWQTAIVDLTAYRGLPEVRILITATGGGGFESDIAVDDLVVFDDGSTGACCTAAGCSDGVSLTACAGLGGIYQGDNSTCAMTDCIGACCDDVGNCTEVTEPACDAAGGTFQGTAADCATTNCPVNGADDCIDPLPEAFDGANPVDLTGATTSGLLAPTCAFPVAPVDNINNDRFYQYTATCTGRLFVDTCGNAFDSRLAIYDADCAAIFGGAAPLECNDDHGSAAEGDTGNTCPNGLSASLAIDATMGTTYVIRVGSFTGAATTGMFDLNIACVAGAECDSCTGDVNGDSFIDGNDIQTFVDCYTTEFGAAPSAACACADVVDDQLIDMNDLSALITALLSKPNICDPGACCFFDGATMCTVTSQLVCDALGGDFTAGGDCSGDPCPVGRCCSTDGLTCNDVSEVECAAIGGIWDGALSCATDPCPIPPPNDTCDTAIEVFCGDLLIGESTVDATDDYDPTAAGCTGFQAIGGDVVYVFNSAVDQQVNVSMLNISYDASLYVVTDCDDLSTCVAGSDSFGLPSEDVSFMATAGTTYFIIADGFTIEGTYDLSVTCVVAGGPEACCFADGSCLDQTPGDCAMNGGTSQGIGTTCATTSCPQPPPANDDCDNAIAVTTGPNAGQANNDSAGADLIEASCQATSNGDVWFVWTADCDGNATIDTEGSVLTTSNDTVLSIYSTSCGGAEVACDDDDGSGLLSTVTFPVLTGEVYYIRVAGFSGNTGDVNINIACASTSMEACCFPDGSCTDEMVGDCAGLGGVGQGGGTDCASTSCPLPPPANDDCANATDVTSTPLTDVVSLADATDDANIDPSCDSSFSCGVGPANNGIWYTYTAASAGDLSVSVSGADTVITFWVGADCNSLTQISCSDPQSDTVSLLMGETVYIAISNWSCSSEPSGDVTVDIDFTAAGGPEACCFPDGSCSDQTPGDCAMMGGTNQGIGTDCLGVSCPQPPPANDDCANAEAISIGGIAMGNTDGATPDGLGFCGTSAGTNGAVWYSVIGDGTTLTADLCGSPFDSKIQIYEDGCGTLTCVTGEDDDFPNCGENDPSVDWCAAMGVEYLIAVQGFSTSTGDYTLTVTSDATPCP